jgi:predicted ArsR family transcriptional regulator
MSETQEQTETELSYDDILSFMRRREWPVTSKLLAGEFGISQQAAYYRLDRLQDRGDVERTKLGKNVVLWRAEA